MILDAETYALSPSVEALVEWAEGRSCRACSRWSCSPRWSSSRPTSATLRSRRSRRFVSYDEPPPRLPARTACASPPPAPIRSASPSSRTSLADKRYRQFVEYAGISARRQGVCGLHVHIGMPGAEECMRALEGVLPWLPLVLALSANSPYLVGEETGLASARAEVLAQLPRAAAPPVFASYANWEAFVERYVRLGLADGYTRFWWDARPHPKFGTLEIRAPDQPTAVELSGAFTALLQALCKTSVEGPPPAPRSRRLRAEPLGGAPLRPPCRAHPPEGRPPRLACRS